MAQQINLLNKGGTLKKELFDAAFMAKATLVLLLGIAGYGWFITQEIRNLAKQRDELALHIQEAQARMLQAASKAPSPDANKSLNAELAAAEEYVHAREQVLAALKTGAVGGGSGFAGMLKALARQSIRGVWLTGVSTNGSGDQMRISGRAVSPDLIAQYIGRLTGEQALRGRTFAAFEIAQPKVEVAKGAALGAALAKVQPPMREAQLGYIEFILSAEKTTAGAGAELVAAKPAVEAGGGPPAQPEQFLMKLLEKSASGAPAPDQSASPTAEQPVAKPVLGVES